MTDDWPNVCVLCAARDRQTRLKFGHVCAACADRLAAELRAIPELAAMAAASVTPGQGTTGSLNTAYGSKPPINLDAVDPALAHVPGYAVPLLVLLEEWCRLIREARSMAPYGPWSAEQTEPTLTVVVRFLVAQVPWCVAEPDFPVDDFAAEVRDCAKALRRWDTEREHPGTMVKCPTLTDGGECGYRLYYQDPHEDVTCRRCGTTRSAMTLAAVAMADGREVWLDPEAAANWLGVSEGTLRQWARQGKVERSHGRYLVRERIGA